MQVELLRLRDEQGNLLQKAQQELLHTMDEQVCLVIEGASGIFTHPPPRSPETVQSAEGEQGKEKRERIIVVVRSPCQENDHADAHPSAHKSVLAVGKPPHGLGVCIWMPLVTGTGNSPVSGTADPRSSQTGQVIRGLR